MVALTLLWMAVMGLLAACGEDDGEGGTPDIFLGLSGLVLLILLIWGVSKLVRSKR